MNLHSLLVERKTAVLKKWFAMAIETYPADTAKFLKKQKDPFANPVGRTIHKGLTSLYDELIGEMDHETITNFLDPIVRIRAIQNFSPAQAVGFIFFLKNAVRESLVREIAEKPMTNELFSFESKIDNLGLMAFNLYMQCREKINDLKANEMRNRTFKAFEKAGLVRDIPVDEPGFKPNHLI